MDLRITARLENRKRSAPLGSDMINSKEKVMKLNNKLRIATILVTALMAQQATAAIALDRTGDPQWRR